MKPGCKTLTREITYSDFLHTGNDAETMNLARDIANSKMKGDSMAPRHRRSRRIPCMQWDYQDRLEIQDAQKNIPVQNIQGPIQQHRRRMGS